MNTNLKNFIAFIVIMVFGVSCKDIQPEPENNQIVAVSRTADILLNYYNFALQQSDGTFGLHHSITMPLQDSQDSNIKSIDASAAFKGTNGEPSVTGISEVKLDNIFLEADEDAIFKNNNTNQLRNMYGKNTSFSFKKNNAVFNSDLYIPKLIKLYASYDISTYVVPISAGTTITWNKDDQNSKGIVIILDYNPKSNNANISQSYPKAQTKLIGVEDTGSYTFTTNDLKDLPSGSSIILSIGRANFALLQQGNKSYAFYGLTTTHAGATIMK
jgi:hypothetical protein